MLSMASITDLHPQSLFDLLQKGKYIHYQASAEHPKLPSFQGDPLPSKPRTIWTPRCPNVLGKATVSAFKMISISHHKHSFLDNVAGLKPTLSRACLFTLL